MISRIGIIIITLLAPLSLAAKSVDVPPALEEWKQWVMDGHEYIRCPMVNMTKEDHACTWVSSSEFNVSDKGVDFTINATLYNSDWLDLPGAHKTWPTNVKVKKGGVFQVLPVRESSGKPQVYLPKGEYAVVGNIPWRNIPSNIIVPRSSGIIELSLKGKKIDRPEIDQNSQLWFRKANATKQKVERNTEKIQVFRLIKDENPAKLVTRVVLDISGEAREIQAGKFLLDNFVPLSLSSSLPARIEKNGALRVQVKPGHWDIVLVARHQGPLSAVTVTQTSDLWPHTEIWSFKAERSLRTVQLQGALTLDPNQTDLPGDWKSFPAYLLNAGDELVLNEIHRGDPTPDSDELNISRNLYLDFDGTGFTTSDVLTGEMKQSLRIDSSVDHTLGSVEVNGVPQLITQSLMDDNTQGIEIRERELYLKSVGRYENNRAIQVSGWKQKFKSASATLHLPPGWSLLASQGIDRASYSWVSRWSLWNIFLVLIIVVATFRLCGILPALIGAMSLLVLYHRGGAPLFIWLNIVAVLALLTVTEGKLKKYLGYYQIVSFLFLILIILPFSLDQIRQSLYPQLEHQFRSMSSSVPLYSDELPAPIAEIADQFDDDEDMRFLSRSKSSMAGSSAPMSARAERKTISLNQEFDPNAIVQTGPSVPAWEWNRVNLSWNGPVSESETLALYLVPPWLNRIGNVLAVLLSVLFAGALLIKSKTHLPRMKINTPATGLALVLFSSSSFYTNDVQASVLVDKELLQELEKRLIKPAECLPSCASIEQLMLNAEKNTMRVTMSIDAMDDIALGLPAWRNTWLPSKIDVGGKPAVVKFGQGGQLFIRLVKGRHQVVLSGEAYSDQVELRFGMSVHNISLNTDGWDISGVRNGFASTGNIRLQRVEKQESTEDVLLPDPIPAFVVVSRQLNLGLQWTVTTKVNRMAPRRGAMSLRIPLLPGESPLNEIQQEDRFVIVEFGANQQQVSWRSILTKQDKIELLASENASWTELWSVEVSPVWHLDYSGIPPIKNPASRSPTWSPWPGEKLSIVISRPAAVEGKSLTIDSASVKHLLGQRSNNSTIQFRVRTSRGQNFPFELPENALFDSLAIDGIAQPLSHASNLIDIPLRPGSQLVEIKWHSDKGVELLSKFPELSLADDVSNVRLNMQLPRDRWPLFVGGPAMGPAVLLWGVLVVVAILSIFLGRSEITPLKTHHWFLLGIGVTSTNIYSPLVIVVWLFLMGLRGKMSLPLKKDMFRLIQICLIVFSVIALISLLVTIPMGLLSSPEMHIVGNGSSAFSLNWYQDRVNGLIPDAWVLSLPLYIYRIAMLLWSLWLAVVLIDWVKWAWLQLNSGGFWNVPNLDVQSESSDAVQTDKTLKNEDEKAKS